MRDGQELPANDATGDAANLSPVKGRWADVEPYEVVAQGGAPQLATVVLCTIDYIIYISVSKNYDDGNMS